MRMKTAAAVTFAVLLTFAAGGLSGATTECDLVVYGSSPAGLAAAVQAKRMGLSAVVVSPENRIGGLTTGGLGQTDIGNKRCFGGIALEFYRDVARHYRDPKAWTREKMTDYSPDGQCFGSKGADSMWTFEPSAARQILEGWERRDGLVIHRGKRLDRSNGKVKAEGEGEQRKIVSFVTEDGTEYVGKMFVDATYEGDLMAAAGVTYTVGREANAVYGETLNGVQRRQGYHKFEPRVSAYVVPGDPKSALLPNVEPDAKDPDGTGDRRVQAYCFRMCLTDDPENRIPFAKPAGYNPLDYELLVRNLVEQEKNHPEWKGSSNYWHGFPWINSRMPNRKTDTNNHGGFSTDFIGRNWAWPEASYAERAQILREHLDYQKGLMWTLANDTRIPDRIRSEVARWGTCRDEFQDGLGDGWQDQLYVREGRRMVGDYVMTEQNCRGARTAPHPVAMGAYSMDSHHVRRYVDANGYVQNEGDVEVGSKFDGSRFEPYGIEYASIVPKRTECGNLFVPICLSASHIAFGSIRMEPVFFALGQVAGTAAALAIADGVSAQDVDYGKLSRRLVADGQVIALDQPKAARESVFFVGAHPDDTEGYAATAFLLRDKYDIHVIDLTRGELGLGMAGYRDGTTAKRRMAEEAAACAYLGATPHFLDEIDGFAYARKTSVDSLAKLIRELKPVAIFTHWPVDTHCDHVQTAAVTRRAAVEAGFNGEYYFFEVLRSQTVNFRPLYSVDVSKTIKDKAEMLRKYVCQNANDGLAKEKLEQAKARGQERRPSCAAAEVFTTYDGRRIEKGVLENLGETLVLAQ